MTAKKACFFVPPQVQSSAVVNAWSVLLSLSTAVGRFDGNVRFFPVDYPNRGKLRLGCAARISSIDSENCTI